MDDVAAPRSLRRLPSARRFCRATMPLLMLAAFLTLGLVVVFELAPGDAYDGTIEPPVSGQPDPSAAYARLPLSFEPLQGRTVDAAGFGAQGRGYTLFVSAAEALFSYAGAANDAEPSPTAAAGPARSPRVARLQFVGADPTATVAGVERLPGVVHYFLGSDPNQWRTGIPTFGKVQVTGAWPGVDLVYYGAEGQVELDFVVAPGADPASIRLRAADERSNSVDAGSPTLDAAGNLLLCDGALQLSKPHIYQERKEARQEIGGDYAVGDDGLISFAVAAYDRSRPLVIDPVLVYLGRVGSSRGDDYGYAVATDSAGNVFIAGMSLKGPDSDFPVTGSPQANVPYGENAFVAKLNPGGTQVLYAAWIGGDTWEQARGIAVDAAGNAYVAGFTQSNDFPTTAGAFDTTRGRSVCEDPNSWDCPDAFVFKLNPSGSQLLYSTFLGGEGGEEASGIAVDANGNAYVVGATWDGVFPLVNAFDSTAGGFNEAFVAKLNPGGSGLIYSTYLGGGGNDAGNGIAVDAAGSAFVTGETGSTDFPTTKDARQPELAGGGSDAFVTQFAPSGSAVLFSTYLGGSNLDHGYAIAVHPEAGIFVAGDTGSTNFPVKSPLQPCHGYLDAFVARLQPGGQALAYSTCLGGNGDDRAHAIAVDFAGLAYVAGTTTSSDFPLEKPAQSVRGFGSDAFVSQLAGDGSALLFSTYLGGDDFFWGNFDDEGDQGYGIAVDANQMAYAAGQTNSYSLKTTAGSVKPPQLTTYYDAWIAKLDLATGGVPVKGRAYALPQADGITYPLIGVPVEARRNDRVLRRAITRADGTFTLPGVPVTDNLKLRVTLRHDAAAPPTFQVTFGKRAKLGGPVVAADTEAFTVTGAEPEVTQDVVFSRLADVTPIAGVPKAHLGDLGVTYFHTHQAWQLTDRLKQPLDFNVPVDVVAFSAEDGVFWRGNVSSDKAVEPDPFINIQAKGSASLYASPDRPDNREWHEFGHHVMADSLGDLFPMYPRGDDNRNHWGYANVVTTDSWTEGFAEYFSMQVADRIASEDRPEVYNYGTDDGGVNLESNYSAMTWTDEEFAVAGLLWDLTDPADADDASVMTGATGILTNYRDCIQEDPARVWSWLTQNYTGKLPLSPVASAQGYGYLFDVKQLYDALKEQGVGRATSQESGLNDLDALFVAHGFFSDVAAANKAYDAGERVGLTGYVGGWKSPPRPGDKAVITVPDRPDRRDVEPVPGSYVAYQALDASSGAAVDVRNFAVEVRFAPPFSHYSYSFAQHAATPGRLYFYAADPQYDVTTIITPLPPDGYTSPAALTVRNDFYWQQMQSAPADFFTAHTFQLQSSTQRVYLPLIMRGGGRLSAALSPGYAGATPRRTPRACTGGSATATPTATSAATSIPAATATPTATPSPSPTPTEMTAVPPTATGTATATPILAGTATATASRTSAQTPTFTPAVSRTPSMTPSPTSTRAASQTSTPTGTPTPSATATRTPARTPTPTQAWGVIFSDGFEGVFPGAWQRLGNPGWGRTNCKSFAGSYSAWPAADGTGAVIPCTDKYPNDLEAWLIYGPFDLRDASAAEVIFQRWQRTELDHDFFTWLASTDGESFYGWQSSGDSQGWVTTTFDLSNVEGLGDLRGQAQVWIALLLKSDDSGTDLGVFLDDVVIRKQAGGAGPAAPTRPPGGKHGIAPATARRPG